MTIEGNPRLVLATRLRVRIGSCLRAYNMKPTTLPRTASSSSRVLLILALVPTLGILAQQPPSSPKGAAPSGDGALPQTPNWTAEQDHQNMMEQLGIKALRPGPSGNEAAPNHANYDESKANPFPGLRAPCE